MKQLKNDNSGLGKRANIAAIRALTWKGLAAIALMGLAGGAFAANKTKLSTYTSGKPATGVSCPALAAQSSVLMGGGTDVQEAFTWMINQSRKCASGAAAPGNFVVVRAAGNPDYDRFIYKLGELASVQTVVVPNRDAANDPELESYIQNASAIWITGGDQGVYYDEWKGTLLMKLIANQWLRYGIPIGGTSAGMMMLSQFNYIATPYTITSAEALADAYQPGAVTIKSDFWTSAESAPSFATPSPALVNTVTDSHFDTRDRMGRLVTFLARIMTDPPKNMNPALKTTKPLGLKARAIGVDQEAALLVACLPSAGCRGHVVANAGTPGHAYYLKPVSNPSFTSTLPKQIAQFGVDVYRLSTAGDFDLINVDSSSSYDGYGLTVTNGTLTSSDQAGVY